MGTSARADTLIHSIVARTPSEFGLLLGFKAETSKFHPPDLANNSLQ